MTYETSSYGNWTKDMAMTCRKLAARAVVEDHGHHEESKCVKIMMMMMRMCR